MICKLGMVLNQKVLYRRQMRDMVTSATTKSISQRVSANNEIDRIKLVAIMVQIKIWVKAAKAKQCKLRKDSGRRRMQTLRRGRTHHSEITLMIKWEVMALVSRIKTCSQVAKTTLMMIEINRIIQWMWQLSTKIRILERAHRWVQSDPSQRLCRNRLSRLNRRNQLLSQKRPVFLEVAKRTDLIHSQENPVNQKPLKKLKSLVRRRVWRSLVSLTRALAVDSVRHQVAPAF